MLQVDEQQGGGRRYATGGIYTGIYKAAYLSPRIGIRYLVKANSHQHLHKCNK